ncbi:hypothetical protein RUM43_001196, partial [Polyplax serrata]
TLLGKKIIGVDKGDRGDPYKRKSIFCFKSKEVEDRLVHGKAQNFPMGNTK